MNFVAGVTTLLLGWGCTVGYMMNIVQIFHASELSFTFAARVLGIVFFPIGIVAGFM